MLIPTVLKDCDLSRNVLIQAGSSVEAKFTSDEGLARMGTFNINYKSAKG